MNDEAPLPPPKKRSFLRQSSFFWISLAVHGLLLIGAATLVVQNITAKRKVSFKGAGEGPPKASERALEYKVMNPTTSASSPALAKRIAAQGASAIALPEMPAMPDVSEVTPMSMPGLSAGSLGFGSGSGAGFGAGGGGGGSGAKISIFGRPTKTDNGVVGYFYDLKQTPERKETGATDDTYLEIIRNFCKNLDPAGLQGFYKTKNPLYLEQIWVPGINAEEAPKAFGVEKEVQPRLWIIHYTGMVTPPKSGTFRFIGYMDDILVVAINKKIVLDGSKNGVIQDRTSIEPWFKLTKGKPVALDIVIGEKPGGGFGGWLAIQNEKEQQELPVLPQFSQIPMPDMKYKEGIRVDVATKPFVFQ